jgi:hypothetical protein
MSTFVEKSGTFVADEGYNDDLAMTLVLFAWLSTNTFFKDLTNVDMRDNLYNSEMRTIEKDLTPFGIIDDGQKEEVFIASGDVWMWADEKEKYGLL